MMRVMMLVMAQAKENILNIVISFMCIFQCVSDAIFEIICLTL